MSYVNRIRLSRNDELVAGETISPAILGGEEGAETYSCC